MYRRRAEPALRASNAIINMPQMTLAVQGPLKGWWAPQDFWDGSYWTSGLDIHAENLPSVQVCILNFLYCVGAMFEKVLITRTNCCKKLTGTIFLQEAKQEEVVSQAIMQDCDEMLLPSEEDEENVYEHDIGNKFASTSEMFVDTTAQISLCKLKLVKEKNEERRQQIFNGTNDYFYRLTD